MDGSTAPILILIAGVVALGVFVVRFGSAMNRLENQVAELAERVESMGKG